MIIDFGTFSDNEAWELLTKNTDLSQRMAKKFLDSMPNNFSNKKSERIDFEITAEGFLFFIVSAKDRLLQEINKKFPNSFPDYRVKWDRLKHNINEDLNPQFADIKKLMDDSFKPPEYVISSNGEIISEWKRDNSWLWEINELRNNIAHRNILNQAVYRVLGSDTQSSPNLIMRIKDEQVTHGTHPGIRTLEIEDPRTYFKKCYDKFEKLKTDVRACMK